MDILHRWWWAFAMAVLAGTAGVIVGHRLNDTKVETRTVAVHPVRAMTNAYVLSTFAIAGVNLTYYRYLRTVKVPPRTYAYFDAGVDSQRVRRWRIELRCVPVPGNKRVCFFPDTPTPIT